MAITDIQSKGNLYYVFDGKKKIKDLVRSSVGELCGFSSEIIVFRKGNLYPVYNEAGKKLKDLVASSVGDFRSVSGQNILFNKGRLVDTYDIKGKKLSSRVA